MLRPRNLLQPAARYPADPRALFILVLSVFSGIVTLIAGAGPESLEALMPGWAVAIWAFSLCFGSFLALLGLSRDTDGGIIIEQIGSVMVGSAAIFYSAIAALVAGTGALGIITIVFAWGLACLVRWFQLQLLIQKMSRDRLHKSITDQFLNSPPREA